MLQQKGWWVRDWHPWKTLLVSLWEDKVLGVGMSHIYLFIRFIALHLL